MLEIHVFINFASQIMYYLEEIARVNSNEEGLHVDSDGASLNR